MNASKNIHIHTSMVLSKVIIIIPGHLDDFSKGLTKEEFQYLSLVQCKVREEGRGRYL